MHDMRVSWVGSLVGLFVLACGGSNGDGAARLQSIDGGTISNGGAAGKGGNAGATNGGTANGGNANGGAWNSNGGGGGANGGAGATCGPGSGSPGTPLGDGPLDALLDAADALHATTRTIDGQIDADLRALATLYGIDVSGGVHVPVDQLVAAVKADVSANVQGNLKVTRPMDSCNADSQAGASALASCQREEGCSSGSACSASADCQSAATIVGLSSLTCSEPNLVVDYTPRAGLTPSQAQTFGEHMTAVETHGKSILNARARLSAVWEGKVNGAVAFTPSPAAQLVQALEAMLAADANKLGLSSSCVVYVAPRITMADESAQQDGIDANWYLGQSNGFAALF